MPELTQNLRIVFGPLTSREGHKSVNKAGCSQRMNKSMGNLIIATVRPDLALRAHIIQYTCIILIRIILLLYIDIFSYFFGLHCSILILREN